MIVAPSTASRVALITVNRSGNRSGNERTGYNVPLLFAFDINAAIIVAVDARPSVPKKIVIIKTSYERIAKFVINVR